MGAPRESRGGATGLAFGLALVSTLACSTSGPSGADAASSDAGVDSSPGTCQSLRLCAFECGDDACVQACRVKGTAAAQAAFDTLEACTAQACAPGDVNCACGEQCLADGSCLAAVDACLGNVADPICDNLCH
jgi:hypothetical protein